MVPIEEVLTGCGLLLTGWFGHAAVTRRRMRSVRHDPVTGLLTRAAWTARSGRVLRRPGQVVALADMDLFKEINDTYGHQAGDLVLAATGARMRGWLDQAGGGVCGRLGGDEFAFVTLRPIAARQFDELAAILARPVALPVGVTVLPGVSVGAAIYVPGGAGLPAALAAADAAMYHVKRTGGRRCQVAAGPPPVPGEDRPVRRTRHHGPASAPARPEPGAEPQPS